MSDCCKHWGIDVVDFYPDLSLRPMSTEAILGAHIEDFTCLNGEVKLVCPDCGAAMLLEFVKVFTVEEAVEVVRRSPNEAEEIEKYLQQHYHDVDG